MHSRLYEIHSCALYREVSRCELFAKYLLVPCTLDSIFFSHYLTSMTIREDWTKHQYKIDSFAVLEIPVLSSQSNKVHAELC